MQVHIAYSGFFGGVNINASRYGGSGFIGRMPQGQYGRSGGMTFGKSILGSSGAGAGVFAGKAYSIGSVDLPSMGTTPFIAAGWALGSLFLLGNNKIKSPGMLFGLTTIASAWPYSKWSNYARLKARQQERY